MHISAKMHLTNISLASQIHQIDGSHPHDKATHTQISYS